MAIGVDTSKWKPRKIQGTPASKFRNRLGIGILSFGIICGTYFHLSSITNNLRTATAALYDDPVEVVERKLLIGSGLPVRTGDQIRKMVEDSMRVDQPDK